MDSGDKFNDEFFCFNTRLSILFVLLAADDALFKLTSDKLFDVIEFAESPEVRNEDVLEGLVGMIS